MLSLLYAFIGLSTGLLAGCALAAFYQLLRIVSRLQLFVGNAQWQTNLLTAAIALGGMWGCLVTLFDFTVVLGLPVSVLFACLYGINIGLVIASLAEVLAVFPVILGWYGGRLRQVIWGLALALGKTVGSLVHFLGPWFQK